MATSFWDSVVAAIRYRIDHCPILGTSRWLADRLRRVALLVRPSSSTPPLTKEQHPMAVISLTDSDFTSIVEDAAGIVMVDFWAPWCMPCRMVSPTIERLGEQYTGKITVAKLNVDENMAVAERFHITGIPTVALFKDGKLVNELVGVRPEAVYRGAIESALNPAPAAKATTSTKPAGHSITVFSTPTCPWCARLKSYLNSQQIAFKDVDVSRDEAAATEMVRRSGQMGVPQAWIDGQVVVGFDRKKIDALLGLATAGAR